MNRTYNSQIIIPKIDGPPTIAPLILNDELGTSAAMMRTTAASTTGPPTTSARKFERRTGSTLGTKPAASSLHQILKHCLEVVVRRRDLVNRPEFARSGHVGQP